MRVLVLLLVLVSASRIDSVNLERTGRPIPLHIPTQTVDSESVFEVPAWLGAFYATVNVSANWTLPLTIGNGGQTYPGEFLFIRNYGPADIVLYAQSPETIEGASNYSISAGSIAEILSGYPNWIIVAASTSSQPTQWINTFSDGTTYFTLEAGPGTYNVPQSGPDGGINTNSLNIGMYAGSNNGASNAINIGYYAGQYNLGYNVVNLGPNAGQYNIKRRAVNIGPQAGQNNTGESTVFIGNVAGQFSTGDRVVSLGDIAGQRNTGSICNHIGYEAGRYNTGQWVNTIGQNAGRNNTGNFCTHIGTDAGTLNTFNYCHTNGRNSACTDTNQFVFGSSFQPLHMRLPSDTGSYCTGAAYDTCLNRGRAGAFTLGTGQDMYSTGFACFGTGCTSAAPSAASTGVYDSNTRVVRSCTAGAGITCSVTDGVLTVSAIAPELQSLRDENDSLRKRVEWLETQFKDLLNKK